MDYELWSDPEEDESCQYLIRYRGLHYMWLEREPIGLEEELEYWKSTFAAHTYNRKWDADFSFTITETPELLHIGDSFEELYNIYQISIVLE